MRTPHRRMQEDRSASTLCPIPPSPSPAALPATVRSLDVSDKKGLACTNEALPQGLRSPRHLQRPNRESTPSLAPQLGLLMDHCIPEAPGRGAEPQGNACRCTVYQGMLKGHDARRDTWLLSLTSGCHSLWSWPTIPNRRFPGRDAFASAAHDPAERERCSVCGTGRASCASPQRCHCSRCCNMLD